jgi:acyl-CoA thioester hydrolase
VENYRHRVLYGDTDQMGVVYYANYLRFFEGARNEWIRSLGLTYAQIEERGIMLPVFEASIQYLKPARYDDLLDIKIVATHTRVKIRFEYKVHRVGGGAGSAGGGRNPEGVALEDEVLALGHTVHACVGRDGRPTRAPDWLLGALGAAGRAEPRSGGALEEPRSMGGGSKHG